LLSIALLKTALKKVLNDMEKVDKDSWIILVKIIIGLFALIGLGFSIFQLCVWILPFMPTELDPTIEKYGNWLGGFVLLISIIYWLKHRIKKGLLEADHGILGNKRKYTNSTGEK
jgi:hypothetical protein